LNIYHGWKIYANTCVHHFPELKRELKRRFDQGEWSFEDNDRTFIYNQNIDSPIEIFFNDETTEEEKAMRLNRYKVVFDAPFFGWKNEYFHRQLCDKVLHKITWQKEAYYLTDDGLIPVKKRRILRMRKR